MKKKLLVFLIFLSFFISLPTTIFATDNQEGGETIWVWITRVFERIFGENISHITNNANPSVLDQKDSHTDYTAENQDVANRITPEALKRYQRGVWFYEILTTDLFGKNKKNEALPIDDKTNCPQDISINDIICFHKKRDEKILYKRNNRVAIEYDDEELNNISPLNCEKELSNPDICYQNLYTNYQDVPKGYFAGAKDAATGVSNQLNNILRYSIAKKGQGQDAPTDNKTSSEALAVGADNDKQDKYGTLGVIPKSGHGYIPCVSNDTNNEGNPKDKDKNREYLRESWKNWIISKKWQKSSLPKDSTDLAKEYKLNDAYCDAKRLEKETFTEGYSQYGAFGMAMLGYSHQKILKSYFGEDKSIYKIPNFSTQYYQVKIYLLDHWEHNGDGNNIDTPANSKEKYQNCIKLANSYDSEIKYEIINIAQAKSSVDWQQPEDPNYNCQDNWPGTEAEFDNKSESEQKLWAEDMQNKGINLTSNINNPKEVWNELKDKWNGSCTYAVTMSVDNYLYGIAEIFNGWHVEAWRSLIIPCRNNLFDSRDKQQFEREKKTISILLQNHATGYTPFTIDFKNAGQQVFRCVSLHDNKIALSKGLTTNSTSAVDSTENQFLVDENYNIIDGNIYSELCEVQTSPPFFDGRKFENVGRAVAPETNSQKTYYGCYQNLDPNEPVFIPEYTDEDDFKGQPSNPNNQTLTPN